MRKKYRYILCGIVNPTDKIKIFRLIAANCLGNRTSAIRIPIPKDMILEKWSCDNYSTTFDERTLLDLEYDVLIKRNGKWIVMNELKSYQPHEFSKILRENYELYLTSFKLGYLTKEEYKEWQNEKQKELDKE